VLEDFHKLREAIVERAGIEAACLFAEPIVTWSNGEAAGSVSWYADAEGDVQPLGNVPADRRLRLEHALQVALHRLMPLCSDVAVGTLLTRALTLANSDGVLAVGDSVVLVDWGLIGANASDTPAGLAAQFERTLGRYALLAPAPATPALAAEVPLAPPLPRPGWAPQVSAAPFIFPRPAPGQEPAPWHPPAWNRWLLPAGLTIAALFLALGILVGARAVVLRPPPVAARVDVEAIRDAVARRQAENAALQGQIDAARRTLGGNLCAFDPAQLPAEVPPDMPIQPAMLPPAPQGGTPFQGTLVDLLKQATVLVLVPRANGASLGSGFFIAPGLVATNRHVVEGAGSDGIVVVNGKLGRPLHATIMAQTPNSTIYNPDVAVLQVADAPTVQPLSFTRTVAQLDVVVAAGFPGVLMRADDNFGRLLHGDLAAMPSVILTDGRINAVQMAPTGLPILPHSAQIAPGNSGGPLVDACGRVVGINTFINVSAEEAIHINYAEKADAVLTFLKANQVPATESAEPCVPGGGPKAEAAPAPDSLTPPTTAPPSPARGPGPATPVASPDTATPRP
jgi:serine protease Do